MVALKASWCGVMEGNTAMLFAQIKAGVFRFDAARFAAYRPGR